MRFFNKTLAFVACCLLLPFTSTQAQVSAYLFSQTSGTYTPITGGTVLGSTTSDDQLFVDPAAPAGGSTTTGVGLPIGFNFLFDGVTYDRFGLNNNGWISFGQSALTPAVDMDATNAYVPISTSSVAPANLQRRIAGLARDLQGQTGSILRFETIGAAPNRVLVVQWTNYRSYLATGENLNFQIRLYETSNRVETVYGTFVGSTANTAQVGLRGTVNTDFNNRSVASGTNTWATSTAGGANTATVGFSSTFAPTSGQIYRWNYTTCLPPVGFSVAGITTVTANFSWTTNIAAGAGQLVIVPQGAVPTTGTIIPVSGTSYNATGLNHSTSYSAYLRRVCAPGDTSNWTVALNFNTLCANAALPWTESFESVPVTTTGGILPNCWARNVTNFATANGAQSFGRSARTGTKYLYTDWSSAAGTGDWAFTPAFTLIAGRQYDFSFWYKADGLTGFDTLRVGVGNTQTPAGMTIIGTPVYNIVNTTYQQYFVSYTPTVTGTYYFGTNVWAGGNPWYIDFDDYNLIETPTCPQPSAIVVSPVSSSTATISWTSNAPGNSWYVYATTATTLGTNMGTLTTSNPHVVTGLTANTNYNFFVREYCAVADTSYWSGPFNFLTDCAPSTQGDSMQTAYNVTTTNYSQSNSNARCYTNTIGNTSPDVWYRVILDPCATQLTASLCTGTSFDSYIRVYDRTGITQLAFNDDGCGSQSIVSNLDVRAHDTVYVVVEGYTTNTGAYLLSITQTTQVPTADITFAAPSYCVNGANPTPSILATTGGVFSSNPSSLGLDPVNGQLNMNTAIGGNSYQIIYSVGQPGCLSVDSFMIMATAADNANFAYATNNALCETNTMATPSITGLAGGTFSTTSTTLSLNTSTGAIDASTSGVGMHNVVYATTGTCPNTQTVMVRIDTTENASFDYSQVSVCKNSAAISPAITGLMGGMFMSGAGLVIDAQTGIIDVAASTAGAYTVTYTMPNACASNSTDAIQVVALDNAAFAYNSATYCQNANHPLPVVTGLAGGTFSSGTGLPVDIGTGLIDLSSASTNTAHTVIYVTDGACINFSIVTVTVIPADDASFAYSANSYCVLGSTPNQTPTISGNTGGTFTASGNLAINASTGAITVSTAATGTYTVRYVTNGPTTCRDTAFATITLQNCPTLSVNEPLNTNAAYTLYPNPNNGQFAIVLSEGEEMVQLSVSDALGRIVYSQENLTMVANTPVQIQLNSLAAGTYYVRLSNANSTKTIPVVIMQP